MKVSRQQKSWLGASLFLLVSLFWAGMASAVVGSYNLADYFPLIDGDQRVYIGSYAEYGHDFASPVTDQATLDALTPIGGGEGEYASELVEMFTPTTETAATDASGNAYRMLSPWEGGESLYLDASGNLVMRGFVESDCDETGAFFKLQVIMDTTDTTSGYDHYIVPAILADGGNYVTTNRYNAYVADPVTGALTATGDYGIVTNTTNVVDGAATVTDAGGQTLWTNALKLLMIREVYSYQADGTPMGHELEVSYLYFVQDLGLVMDQGIYNDLEGDTGLYDVEAWTDRLVKYTSNSVDLVPAAQLGSYSGSVTDESFNPLTRAANGARVLLDTVDAYLDPAAQSAAPVDKNGNFTIYYDQNATYPATLRASALYFGSYEEYADPNVTPPYPFDTAIMLYSCPECTPCMYDDGGMTGGGSTPGVGIYMTGQIWADDNGNAAFDSGEGVASLWIDVWDEATYEWGGTSTNSDGTYSIDLPVATGDFEVSVWPDWESNSAVVGGTFQQYAGDDLSDGSYDGTIATDWMQRTLVAVDGADVEVNIEVTMGVTISGTVVDGDGVGIQYVWVNACSDTGGWGGGETDASGAFSFSVPEGTGYDLWIDTWNLADGVMGGYFLDEDGDLDGTTTGDWMNRTLFDVDASGVSGIVVHLASGNKIFGHVYKKETDGSLTPVPWLWIDANSDTTGSWGGNSTDINGAFSMAVEPGAGYRVSTWPYEGDYVGGYFKKLLTDNPNTASGLDGKLTSDWENATLLNNTDGDVEINLILGTGNAISGRVTDELGNGIPWVWVDANSEVNWSWYGGSTDAEGYYRIPVAPAADYRVQVWSNGTYQTMYYNQATRWEDATLVDVSSASVSGVDFVLSNGESISGTVSGLQAGDYAWIDAWSDTTWAWGGANVDGTGADVDYVINGLVAGSDYRLSVWADGYQTGNLKADGTLGSWEQAGYFATGATDADITLSAGKQITGTVTGTAAGDYVWIDAWSESTWNWGGTSFNATGDSTDYTIKGLASADDYRVSIWADGYQTGYYGGTLTDPGSAPVSWDRATLVTVNGDPVVAGVNFALSAGNTISGTITFSSAPDPYQWIWIDAWSDSTWSWGGANIQTEEGETTYTYTIKGLDSATDFRVSVWADGYIGGYYSATGIVNWDEADFVDSSTSPANIDFTLSSGKSISGSVTGLDANEWAWIDAWSESTWSWGGTGVVGNTAGTALNYEINGLAAASDFVVSFWPDNHAKATATADTSAADVTGLDFVAGAGKTISGSISNATAGTWVWVDAWSETTWDWGYADVKVDANGAGTYEIKGMADASDYKVSAWNDGQNLFYNQQLGWNDANLVDLSVVEVGGTATGIDFDFAGVTTYRITGTIAGLASDETVWIDAWDEATWAWAGTSRTGNGTFTIKNLPAGSHYRVALYSWNYADGYYGGQDTISSWSAAQLVTLPDTADVDGNGDDNVDLGTLTMSSGYSISGTVTDNGTGNPLPYLWVDAYNQSAGIWGGDMTNANGEYEISGLSNGDYTITIWSADGSYTDTVTVSNADATLDIAVGSGTGGIAGTVTQGGAVDGAVVVVFDNADGSFVQAVETNASGEYSVGGLITTTTYTVKVNVDPAVNDVFDDLNTNVTVIADTDTTVNFAL